MKLLKTFVLTAGLLLSSVAGAATYWVSQTASGGGSGADTLANAMTLAEANAAVEPGDVVRFRIGNGAAYTAPIGPARSGTNGARITYLGWQHAPRVIKVTDIDFDENGRASESNGFFTVKWVETAALEFSSYYADACSLLTVTGTAVTGLDVSGNLGAVIDSLTATGNHTGDYWSDFGQSSYWTTTGLIVKNSTFNVTTACGSDNCAVRHISRTTGARFENNTYNITFNSATNYFFGDYVISYNTGSVRDGETWNFTFNGVPPGTTALWQIRDYCYENKFLNATVTTTGTGKGWGFYWNPGSGHPIGNTRISGCTFKLGHNLTGYSAVGIGFSSQSDTLDFNTFYINDDVPFLNTTDAQALDGLLVRHNTVVNTGGPLIDLDQATIPTWSLGAKIVSNIFYSTAANSNDNELLRLPASGLIDADSAGTFFALGGNAAYMVDRGGTNWGPGDPFFGTTVWGTPVFADSTYATFNGLPGDGSYAVNDMFPDKYCGSKTGVTIGTRELPIGQVTLPYSGYVGTRGGTAPFAWTVTAGTVPDGLFLHGVTGELGGTPEVEGTFNFTVTVVDANGSTDTQAFSVQIRAAGYVPPTPQRRPRGDG